MNRRGIFRTTLRRAEKTLRGLRHDLIVKPLVRSRVFRKYYEPGYDAVIIDFGDHHLAFEPNDQFIGASIDHTGGWFRQESQCVFDALPVSGKVFVDVGANIGTQSVYALMFGGFENATTCRHADRRTAASGRLMSRSPDRQRQGAAMPPGFQQWRRHDVIDLASSGVLPINDLRYRLARESVDLEPRGEVIALMERTQLIGAPMWYSANELSATGPTTTACNHADQRA